MLDLGGNLFRLRQVGNILQQGHELIAANARHRVGFTHARRDAARNRLQQLVAGNVAVLIVDLLEVVEVDEQ
ncbi:hypothetical protein D3C86_1914920 [compost metagenome]